MDTGDAAPHSGPTRHAVRNREAGGDASAYAPGRTLYGEQFHRAAYSLAAITGNVGISGGNSGLSGGAKPRIGGRFTSGRNPAGARVSSPLLADLLARGKASGYPADIKMIYSAFGDLVNQFGNVNKTVAALEQVEFVVVAGPFCHSHCPLHGSPASSDDVLGAQ